MRPPFLYGQPNMRIEDTCLPMYFSNPERQCLSLILAETVENIYGTMDYKVNVDDAFEGST
ncbi:MAG: hypothetical protein STSR0007_05090 [Thermovirga sp.]